ncbi:chitinase [Filimonas lacunae]|uniref:chitinase n=1 Tax=Filimonas lacunae TaxID=477680 RepID=A0A173MG55_9BACT|nr:glycoside hydrolase family 18 protein [Filimonas lacunae]BAV06460.1 chitinase [Filimonas lacunae]SIT27040.1 chitinase [Filimonas lacunae]
MKTVSLFLLVALMSLVSLTVKAQSAPRPTVIGYYSGDSVKVSRYPVEKLTHLIFSFGHLRENEFFLNKRKDTLLLQNMVALKKRNPSMKVMVSLGGWSGCATCSPIFANADNRKVFARSVKKALVDFGADGIDLDWEYPAIQGFPGHAYSPDDRANFTALIKALRKELGKRYEISFAAGGFTEYLEKSIDWKQVMPMVDRVNLMTYDLVSGYSTISGHHTPLYSTAAFPQSVDRAVTWLDSIGVPVNKLVLGAAFYARIFETKDTLDHGLNRPASFKRGLSYKDFRGLTDSAGFTRYWDAKAQAPYSFNPHTREFASYDDSASIALKTKYVWQHHLNGIMFWELADDKESGGLLDVIDETLKKLF